MQIKRSCQYREVAWCHGIVQCLCPWVAPAALLGGFQEGALIKGREPCRLLQIVCLEPWGVADKNMEKLVESEGLFLRCIPPPAPQGALVPKPRSVLFQRPQAGRHLVMTEYSLIGVEPTGTLLLHLSCQDSEPTFYSRLQSIVSSSPPSRP